MVVPPPQRIWNLGKAVSHNLPAANPRSWGKVPFELKDMRRNMPVFMHSKRITFGTIQHKHTHARRAFFPNVVYRPLYSRALDMQIWSCVSTTALREMDAWGGLDEYIMGISDKKLGSDPVTLMYKRKITEEIGKRNQEAQMNALLTERYGEEYLKKISATKNS